MEILLYSLIIATISIFVLLIYSLIFGEREQVVSRLDVVKDSYNDRSENNEMRLPFSERVIRPAYKKVVDLVGKTTPKGINDWLARTITYAGSPNNLNVNRMTTIMFMSAALLAILAYLLFGGESVTNRALMIVLSLVLGIILPLYIIHVMARNRQMNIQKKLPDMLDLIFVSVEAGLGFDMAIQRTTEKMSGPLAEEFDRAMEDIKRGRKREEALRAIARRTGVDDLSSFIAAVIQAEQLGANVANMLRIQASTMRQKRRQRVEEKAMKISVKMLFPMVFFMLPALFIVILGPAIIRMITVLGDLF